MRAGSPESISFTCGLEPWDQGDIRSLDHGYSVSVPQMAPQLVLMGLRIECLLGRNQKHNLDFCQRRQEA